MKDFMDNILGNLVGRMGLYVIILAIIGSLCMCVILALFGPERGEAIWQWIEDYVFPVLMLPIQCMFTALFIIAIPFIAIAVLRGLFE
jgi:hypothetical protein